ncbi:hypothetical protein RVR_862 [Actinacidiphila reveromycinica]|uniref:Iron-containing redox enzyme family protein n=1 Tax=Actinacidiphila reveromycinica TaxID=659352 RepID=A0A7U3UNI5_9ACTN|nr:iron-containing redox enzyme family protein [Streptomyces sp. SN-593]BBA95843.1 hypothetical protein RVR_862 [Streptomyces sp. SN-593]
MTAGTAVPAGTALSARLLLTAPAVRAATTAMWRAPGLARRYGRYLEDMHGLIRASVPLMQRAASRCADLGDAVGAPLAAYLRVHVEEERGHDDWLLDDIAALGGDPAAVRDRQPSPAVARLAGAQYYWIEHHHPVALLGYIAVLESNAPAPWLADEIAAAGVPEAALRTVRGHAELDTGHTAELFALLDGLPLDPPLVNAVVMSALHTVDGLVELFAHIGRAAQQDHSRERTHTS